MRNRTTAKWGIGLVLLAMAVALWWQGHRSAQTEVHAPVTRDRAATKTAPTAVTNAPKLGPLLTHSVSSSKLMPLTQAVPPDPKFPYRLRNTTNSVESLVRSDRAILLQNALIDTGAKAQLAIPEHLLAKGDPGSYLVQSRGPINDAFRAQLAAVGAEFVAYIPNNAVLVRVDADGADKLARMSWTRSVLPYEPYYKIADSLLRFAVDESPIPMSGLLRLTFFPGELPSAREKVEQLGGKIVMEDRSPFGPQLIISPNKDSLVALASLSEVQTIEPQHKRVHMNDLSRVRVGVSENSYTNGNYRDLTGYNTYVNLNDSGVDTAHPALTNRVYVGFNTSSNDVVGHGTHVAGIIAGDGTYGPTINLYGSASSNSFRGMAPQTDILIQDLYGMPDYLLAEYAARTNLYLFGKTNTLISNNSWGYDGSFEYDSSSAIVDAATRDAIPGLEGSQPMLFIFSAGNDGFGSDNGLGGLQNSVTSPAVAKNVIAVGASELLRYITNEVNYPDGSGGSNLIAWWKGDTDSSNQVSSFSSRGNTGPGREGDYGRFKPDVVAPGNMVISTRSTTWDYTNYYNPISIITNRFTNILFSAGQTGSFSLYIPDGTTNLTIQALSGSPAVLVPGLLIYTNQTVASPSSSSAFLAGTNPVSIPIDPNGYGIWFYDIVNTNSGPVTVEIREITTITNNYGDLFQVLSNLNASLTNSAVANTNYYRFETGTSMAAPVVSGTMALIQQFFETDLGITNASPALLKALVINGSRTLNDAYGYEVKGQINYQGWGLVNLSNTLPIALTSANPIVSWPLEFFDQSETNALATGQTQTRNLTMSDAAKPYPLRVTLVWTDPPGNPAAGIKLVNDLDLIITNNDTGEIYYGNNFPSGSIYSVGSESDTNSTSDVINNVENIYLQGDLSTSYSISVVAKRVNVNAVTAHTNNVVQDFALVVSSGNLALTNAFTLDQVPITTVNTNPTVKYFTNSTNSLPLLSERVGANPPLITDTNGTNVQWNFYVITNDSGFTNITFLTFLPPNLSGEPVHDPYRNQSADIDLYVSTSSDLTNLNSTVIQDCFQNTLYSAAAGGAVSVTRQGTEAIVLTNSPVSSTVYYVGVKSEDQRGADFGFFAIATQTPPFTNNGDGTYRLDAFPLPSNIPDGTPELPGGVQMFTVMPYSLDVNRVVVSNVLSHDLFGDIVGTLEHNNVVVTLHNHSFPDGNQSGTMTLVYDDSGEDDLTGTRPTDGPGSLRSFVGEDPVGVWTFNYIDNSPGFVGSVNTMSLYLRTQETNRYGGTIFSSVNLNAGSSVFGFINVPATAVGVTFTVQSSVPGNLTGIYVRKGAFPDGATGLYDYAKVAGTDFNFTISKADVPPLVAGRYFVQIWNQGATADYTISYQYDLDLAATAATTAVQNTKVSITDDALTSTNLDDITVTSSGDVAGVRVGVRIDHERVSDLSLRLTKVGSGISTLLAEGRGGTTTNGFGLGTNANELVYSVFSEDATLPIKFADPTTVDKAFVHFVTPVATVTNILGETNSYAVTNSGSGTDKEFWRVIPTGTASGQFSVRYMFYTAPDRLQVYYENASLADTTSTSNPSTAFTTADVDPVTDTFNIANTFVAGDDVSFLGSTLPGGLNERTRYFVINPTATSFQLATSAGGSAIDITSTGDGVLYQWLSIGPVAYSGTDQNIVVAVNSGVTPSSGTLWDYVVQLYDSGGTPTNPLQALTDQRAEKVSIVGTNLYLIGATYSNGTNGLYARFGVPVQTNQLPYDSVNWPDKAGGTRFYGVSASSSSGAFVAASSYTRTTNGTPPGKTRKGLVVKFPSESLDINALNLGSLTDVQVPAASTDPGAFSYAGIEEMHDSLVSTEGGTEYVYVTGFGEEDAANSGRLYLAKLDTAGNIQWVTNDGGAGPGSPLSAGYALAKLGTNIYVAGINGDSGTNNPLIVKYDTNGVELTRQTVAVLGQYNGLTAYGDALYAVGVQDALSGPNANFLITKFDTNLAVVWSTNYDLGAEDILNGVVAVGDRLYAVGSTVSASTDGIMMEISQEDGSLITRSGYPGYVIYDGGVTQADTFNGIATDGTDLYVVGSTTTNIANGTDAMIMKYHFKDDYLPEESLNQFVGEPAAGTWRLEVIDKRAGGKTNVVSPSILGWQLSLYLADTNTTTRLVTPGTNYTGTLRGAQTNYFTVTVPLSAASATNTLTLVSNVSGTAGLEMWFDQYAIPTASSTKLLTGVSGTSQAILTKSTTPQLVPGQRYFLAIANTSTNSTNEYSLTVDFDSSASTYLVTGSSQSGGFGSTPNVLQSYQFFIPASNNFAALMFYNLTGDVDVYLKHGQPASTTDYDTVVSLTATNRAIIPIEPTVSMPDVSGFWYAAVKATGDISPTYDIRVAPPNTAPALAAISDTTVAEGSALVLQPQASDVDAPYDTLTYSFGASAPAGMSIDGASGLITWTPTEAQGPGVYGITVRVTDDGYPSLYTERTFNISVQEVNTAPVLPVLTGFSAAEGSLFTTTITATDADLPANTLTYSLSSAPSGMTINASTGVISWTPSETDGGMSHDFTVIVSDNQNPALTDTRSYSVSVSEVNSAPVFANVPAQTVKEGSPFVYTVTATDPDIPANSLVYRLVGTVPDGMSINPATGQIAWTPTEAQGPNTYSVTVEVEDDGTPHMTAQKTISITVEEVNQAPTADVIPDQTINELEAWSYQIVASDPDIPANTLSYSVFQGPSGMSVSSSGLITWTPTEAQGPMTTNVVVIISDDGTPSRGISRSFNMVVNEVNSAPVMDPIADTSVTEGNPLVITPVVTDSDIPVQTLTYSLTGNVPAGLNLNTATGKIQWTPTEAQGPGSYPLTLQVSDGVATASRSFTITVNEDNATPVFGTIPDVTVYEGQTVRLVVTATDADQPAQTLTYSLESGAPSGATINASTGAFEWPTDEDSPASNSVTVKVTDNGVPPMSATHTFTITVNEVQTNVVDLVSGVAVTNQTRYAESVIADLYHLSVTSQPAKVLFEAFNLTGNGDLLVRRGAYPTGSLYDYSSASTGTNHEQVIVSTNDSLTDLSGDWYATVVNRETTNITYSISGTVPVAVSGGTILVSTEGIKVDAPTISSSSPSPEFTWSTVPGEKYVVEVSSNLVDWSVLTNVSVDGPTASFTDPTPYTDSQLRFYRIRQVPQ